MTRQGNNNQIQWAILIFLALAYATNGISRRPSTVNTFGFLQLHNQRLRYDDRSDQLFLILRGGSTAEATEDDDNDTKSTNDGNKAEDDDDAEASQKENADSKASIMSSTPVRILIQTNWGSTVLDHRVELMAARTRNIATLKKSLSRVLPGRPPLLGLELVYEGRVLEDEMLVDELFDDDDEEEEEDDDQEGENEGPTRLLILNAVPPVDRKFATELAPKLKAHFEDDDDTLSTEEIIDAYFLNQAAMARNAQLLSDPKTESSPLLRLEIQEQAKRLREQLKAQIPLDVWEKSLEPVRKDHHTEERRGQRYRSGKGGARTNLKKSIQHNLNIHWGETIRNFVLFLFFGYFGGRNSLSRTLMLWGAPLCFVLQARPVKMWSKVLFYMTMNPPGIISSLLPAPQQAILNADLEKSNAALYSTEEEKAAGKVPPMKPEVADDEELDEVADDIDGDDEEEDAEVEESETEVEDDEVEGEEESDS